jgi:tetratricopeptide (TPR) repeat protein
MLVLLLVLLAGCSSAPERQDEVFDQRNQAAQYNDFGNDFLGKGDYEQALKFFTLALAYNGAVDNRQGMAESYNALGKAYAAQGNYEEAARHFDLALEIARNTGDVSIEARALNNVGEAAFSRGEFAVALEQFAGALEVGGNEVPDPDKAVILHNLGSASRRVGSAEDAESYYRKALAINTKEKLWREAASNYYMLASLDVERGDYAQAMTNANLALDADKKVENSIGIGKDYVALGKIADRMGETDAALDYFERSVFVYRSMSVVSPRLVSRETVLESIDLTIDAAGRSGADDLVTRYRGLRSEVESSP